MSDEVSQFLEQVERLRGQQIEEDEVRARELEEYLAAKRERQARREERARSISPQKSSPANTPSPRSNRRSIHLTEALKLESPIPASAIARDQSLEPELKHDTAAAMDTASSPTKENQPPLEHESKTAGPPTASSRASPLAWQRRPNSRGSGRPLSMVAAQNATQRSLTGSQEPHSATEQTFSRDQIAQSLGSKDPAWFRQTADRGIGSAAYRKNQVEDNDRLDMSSVKAQLPGMSASNDNHLSQPDRAPAQLRLASPEPLVPAVEATESRPTSDATDAPTGRTSPIRTTSPTKGMGGFVQSAMMKRSDSVKRWSVVSPPGLTRADTVTSGRAPLERNVTGGASLSTSRPVSRQGEKDQEPEIAAQEEPVRQSAEPSPRKVSNEDAELPISPSKTMDSRRWSPTKTSWLESALNKPESPKPGSKPAMPSQPSWRVDLKNKTERSNTPDSEASRGAAFSHRHQVSIGGLMRSSPMGAAARNTTGLGGIYSPPPGGNRPVFGHGSQGSVSRMMPKPESTEPEAEATGGVLLSEPEPPISTATTPFQAPKPKSKPETPPKKDFRAGLKQRSVDLGSEKPPEPEFKNVFGNLRRTKTQNYVAPDELKSNILQGKAALNVTGGPQKSERKDEFKDAILQKKEAFKRAQVEGKGVARTQSSSTSNPVPEGIARRAELGRSAETKSTVPPMNTSSPKPIPGPKRIPSQPLSSPDSPAAPQPPVKSPQLSSFEKKADTETRTASPTPRFGARVGGKLADRFNPALANILARGPPPMATNGGKGSEESDSRGATIASDSTEPSAPGPQLTHMTKGRARGPKRRAPTTAAAATSNKASTAERPTPKAEQEEPKTEDQMSVAPLTLTRNKSSGSDMAVPQNGVEKPASPSIQEQVAAKATLRGRPSAFKAAQDASGSPQTEQSRPVLRRLPTGPGSASTDEPAPLRPHKTGDAPSQPGSPKKLDMKRMSKFLDESNNAPMTPREPIKLTHQRTGSRSPVKLAERRLPEPIATPAPSAPVEVSTPARSPSATLGKPAVKSPPLKPKPSFDKAPQVTPPAKTASRPLPPPPEETLKAEPAAVGTPVRTPSRTGTEVSALISEFFGPDRPKSTLNVDTAEILMHQPRSTDKVRTSGFHLYQISSDGKKIPIAQDKERVLFEEDMYVCAHEFATPSGRPVVEVYFWVGDEVPESSAEDAQLFAQREARSLGGKLVRLRQGKETAPFIQAMGGIIIVRKGSSSKFDPQAPKVLCGRRYLGQVTFDEVEFASTSLCSGFPYLITRDGRCYLWKGKGSDVDELGCARLVGMDLTPTGDLIEVEDGSEPQAFWGVFDGGLKPHSADHWRLKPSYTKYCTRLFCSDAESKQQIFEISPFSQTDLSPVSIYVLDAFFEMYIVVGARAQSQYASFSNALNFAQEYAILAAGMEDRPFVPISTVVLQGIPRDLKSVFRKWSDALSPTVTTPPASAAPARPGLKRKKSLKVVPLTQVLKAVSQ